MLCCGAFAGRVSLHLLTVIQHEDSRLLSFLVPTLDCHILEVLIKLDRFLEVRAERVPAALTGKDQRKPQTPTLFSCTLI